MGDLTALLEEVNAGDESAWSDVLKLVYDDLRRVAGRQVGQGSDGHTFGATGLVHECYLRMQSANGGAINNRAHFFALASRIMRQILCDYARDRLAAKRGSGAAHVALEDVQIEAISEAQDLVEIDQLLRDLERDNPRGARVFECRFFAGLTDAETAEALDLSLRTTQRTWEEVRTWVEARRSGD